MATRAGPRYNLGRMKTYYPLIAVLLVFSFGCPTVNSNWAIHNATPEQIIQAQVMIEIVKTLVPDYKGYLAAGGDIYFKDVAGMEGRCGVAEGYKPSGCGDAGLIEVLLSPPRFGPDIGTTTLAHELCHLGLTRGGGYCGGPVAFSDETSTDQCAATALVRYREVYP